MNFGEKLQMLRNEKGLTQQELSEKIGVTKRTLQGWEKDGRHPKQADLYDRLAEVLGVEVSLLRSDTDLFITKAGEAYGAGSRRQAEKMVDDFAGMFAAGNLSEEDKDAVMQALQEVYWDAKKINRKKYTPFRFRDNQ